MCVEEAQQAGLQGWLCRELRRLLICMMNVPMSALTVEGCREWRNGREEQGKHEQAIDIGRG
jgi:hypothetical protein